MLLITLDTTRADLFTCNGASRSIAPHLDQFAEECLVCTRAMTTAPMTQTSHTSILTGLYPFAHGIHDNGPFRLADSQTTLAEAFAAEGYRTEAILAATVLDRGTGLDQGFERYDEVGIQRGRNLAKHLERRGDEITDRALQRLAIEPGRPWFLWLHYFDPHTPYRAPGSSPSSDARTQYHDEVQYLDEQLGRLLDALRLRADFERTAVLITADHGEGLLYGTESTHGILLEDHTTRVPLFLRVPGGSVRGTLPTLVSTVDVFPTLWGLVSADAVVPMHGVDLLEQFRDWSDHGREFREDRAVYFEAQHPYFSLRWAPLVGFVSDRWRFVRGKDERLEECDLEGRGLREVHDEQALTDARGRFERLTGGVDVSSTAARTTLSPAEAARLATLGYLASTEASAPYVDPGTLPDPRDCYGDYLAYDQSMSLAGLGRYPEAVAKMQEVVAHHPGNPWFLDRLGRCLMGLGRVEEGMDALRTALERMPDLLNAWYFLGLAHAKRDELDDAERCFARVLELFPEHYDARAQLREVHRRLDQDGEVLLDTLHLLALVEHFDPAEIDDELEQLDKKLERAIRAVRRLPDAAQWQERASELLDTLSDSRRASVRALLEDR